MRISANNCFEHIDYEGDIDESRPRRGVGEISNLLEIRTYGGLQLGLRKHYDKEFKAKVAIEALRGEKTIQEIGTGRNVSYDLLVYHESIDHGNQCLLQS